MDTIIVFRRHAFLSQTFRRHDGTTHFDIICGCILASCKELNKLPSFFFVLAPLPNGQGMVDHRNDWIHPCFDHWEFFLRARATENQCWVVASGQYGLEPRSGIALVGRSMIIDPWGEVLAERDAGAGVVQANLDMMRLGELRERFPALKHRRGF